MHLYGVFKPTDDDLRVIDSLVPVGRRAVEENKLEARKAGQWLDERYSHEWALNEEKMNTMLVTGLGDSGGSITHRKQPKAVGNILRADRIEAACWGILRDSKLRGQNRWGSIKKRAADQREDSWIKLILGLLVTDEDAPDYLVGITDLALAPWESQELEKMRIRSRIELMEFAPTEFSDPPTSELGMCNLVQHQRVRLLFDGLSDLVPEVLEQLANRDS